MEIKKQAANKNCGINNRLSTMNDPVNLEINSIVE